jgi:dihydroflavonol-4-reductase
MTYVSANEWRVFEVKVAVTGAAGFLGTNLINQLVERGHKVTAIDRVRSNHARTEGVEWVMGNVLDPESMMGALDGAEVIYHLVAVITLAQRDDKAWKRIMDNVDYP